VWTDFSSVLDEYPVTQSQIQLVYTAMPLAEQRTGNTCSSSWENYDVVGKHVDIKNLFLSNFIKWKLLFEIFAE
jgi:hypothetical protein